MGATERRVAHILIFVEFTTTEGAPALRQNGVLPQFPFICPKLRRENSNLKRNQMRNLIFAINITIDGCCDHTKVDGGEEILDYFTHLLRDVDVLVYGRKTYQLMVPFWPDVARNHSGQTRAMNDFAQAFDAVNQIIVFSQSLDRAEGKNTRILRTNLRDEILKLKQEQGKAILAGGVTLPSQLVELGLVNEYQFVVHPVLAGEGRRLLGGINLQERLQLKLVESKILKSGCVALRYLKQ